MKPRILFFGTPEFAVYPLQKLIEFGSYDIAAVVTQTDKPSGRGNKLSPPPVKQFASSVGLKVFQPRTLKQIRKQSDGRLVGIDDDGLATFLTEHPHWDAFIVVAYGKIIPESLLDIPHRGIINIHYSLLPRWRGAAPVQRAILAGDTGTGITIMRIDQGLDSGPIYAAESVPILKTDTSGSLLQKLNEQGTNLLLRCLPAILDGTLLPIPQSDIGVTYAEKMLSKDFDISWHESAEKIAQRVRAASPYPGARTQVNGELIKVFQVATAPNRNYPKAEPGVIVEVNRAELIVATGEGGYILIEEMQLPGKKRLPVGDILRGRNFGPDMKFI